MRIHVVTPVTTAGLSTAEDFADCAWPGVTITQSDILRGPATIESAYDEALAVPDAIRAAATAVAEGAEAIVIDCMTDPGLAAIREVTRVPVLGPAESSMHLAAMLGRTFAVISASQAVLPTMHALAAHYGVADRLCAARSVDIPVHELGDAGRLREALLAEAVDAVDEDGAHVIVLGCTGMRGWAAEMQRRLADAGHDGIPVIDPVAAAIRLAQSMVALRIAPSRRTYMTPVAKEVLGFDQVVAAVDVVPDDRTS